MHEFGLDQGMASRAPKYEQLLICLRCDSSCHTWRWMGLFGRCTNSSVNCLKLGDNFVVNTKEGNKEGVDFYVVFCIHPMHVLEEDYTCHGGT